MTKHSSISVLTTTAFYITTLGLLSTYATALGHPSPRRVPSSSRAASPRNVEHPSSWLLGRPALAFGDETRCCCSSPQAATHDHGRRSLARKRDELLPFRARLRDPGEPSEKTRHQGQISPTTRIQHG
ncbi:hypothetical protein BCR35DRAFT_15681 [Leucosporidium creatinivorum]|uniref:Uncharacterized protein n=1 Tax=Leucosporidium creatinivorum TaxID=106004 RepID=A0A1Y2FWW3_9BASI|nr:hypothetical protein BCR35DRAFT_15681 [Leucosporidium creatinivorum]